jgi:SAM-dependent methyltransferase
VSFTETTRTRRPRRAKTSPKRGSKKPRLSARTADKHVLYQRAVQDPKVEVDFFDKVFRATRKRRAKTLLEDFCGAALVCGEWVSRGAERWATGVDIDAKVLAWGKKHNLAPLGEARERITLRRQDVRDPLPEKYDCACALNFSYWVFKSRSEMRGYFENVRRQLVRDGMFVLDVYGGWEAHETMQERRRVRGGFTYVWDQNQFDPITHDVTNYIHFEFPDGSKMKRAFSYHWRFWTLPELRELLEEAGFSEVRVYWDHADEDGDEEDYRPARRAETQPGFVAYLVALR